MNTILSFLNRQGKFSAEMNARKIFGQLAIAFIAVCTSLVPSYGQQKRSTVELADQYYAAGEYYTAANLYGQYLNPPKSQAKTSDFPLNIKARRSSAQQTTSSRTDILFRQAESYRLANYWKEAAIAYKECSNEHPAQYAAALYWYAVCERSLGHYDMAWESVKQYLGDANNNEFKEAAQKELETLQYIHGQLARPDSVLVKTKKLDANGILGNDKGLFAPVHVSGNEFLITSSGTDSVLVNGVNPYHSRLFYASLNSGSLENIRQVPITSAEPASNQGAATISPDGKYLYLSQWKKENGKTVSSIYYAEKQAGSWSTPTLLVSVNTTGYSSKQPYCTSDGKYLFFASDRPGGSGNYDIWFATLKNDGSTGEPVNAGPGINTAGDEQAPFYQTSSNTLVYASNGRQGMGGYDLFAAKGDGTNWKSSENLGFPVNSSRDDIYFFAPERTALLSNAIFSSDRGEGCCLETYNIVKTSKSKKLTGVVRDCKDNTILADAQVILRDATGKTWKTTTDADGKYGFDLGTANYESLTFAVTRELYQDTTVASSIQSTDESDLLTDKLANADLCIQKRPEPQPEPVLVIKAENVVTVYFDFDKSLLRAEAVAKLDSIYQVLAENPTATIQISGYTDGLGSDAYNKILSDKRARACASYIIKKGIDASRVTFVSFGKCCPVEMELINGRDNPDGRSRNRRALINVNKGQ